MPNNTSCHHTKKCSRAWWPVFVVACGMQISAGAQTSTSLGALDAGSWESIDTIVSFDPKTYEERVEIRRVNYAPLIVDAYEAVYQRADQPALPPGGYDELKRFMQNNLAYPPGYQPNGYALGIEVVVEKDGSLSYPMPIYYSPAPRKDLAIQGLRLIPRLPRWTPAKHQEQTVRSFAVIPVYF